MALAGKAAVAAKVNLPKVARDWFIANGFVDHTDAAMLVSTEGETKAGIVDLMTGDGKNDMKKPAASSASRNVGSATGTSMKQTENRAKTTRWWRTR